MKVFPCPNCSSTIFFENTICEYCNTNVGFNSKNLTFEIVSQNSKFSYCHNHEFEACNWLIDDTIGEKFCVACALNRIIPNKSDIENFERWKRLEMAKHRLIYQLLKLKLPIVPKNINEGGIAFDFLSENNEEGKRTGHANGVITILLNEADSIHREQMRKTLEEPYRTLLGHFRHEIGHYYWEKLFDDTNIESYRALFGDERINYSLALKNHYNEGPQKDWRFYYISKYASSHSWEDWAESWAHFLHLMDILETANSLGVCFENKNTNDSNLIKCTDPYLGADFLQLFDESIRLTYSVNSLNRAMGLSDIYPFVIPNPVFKKLKYIHGLLIK